MDSSLSEPPGKPRYTLNVQISQGKKRIFHQVSKLDFSKQKFRGTCEKNIVSVILLKGEKREKG